MPKLTKRQQKFVEAVVDPNIPTGKDAALVAGYSENNARHQASRNLSSANICQHIEELRKEAEIHADTSYREIVGQAVRETRFDIESVLDEQGNFDLNKARQTGATKHIKKLKVHQRTDKDGSVTITHEAEFVDPQKARDQAASMLGYDSGRYKWGEKMREVLNAAIEVIKGSPEAYGVADEASRAMLRELEDRASKIKIN